MLKDVQPSSAVTVTAVCDCCGEEYRPTYKNYNMCHARGGYDSCRKCSRNKAKETMINKYGKEHYQQTDECKSRKERVFIEKYGVSNPSQIKEVQEKKKQTNREKFGTDWFVQSEDFKNMCIERYGKDNPMKDAATQEKAAKSLLKNGNIPVSKEETRLVGLLSKWYGEESCIPSYEENRFIMDCLLTINDVKIDIEYDGAYWHKSRIDYDETRNKILINRGYKVLRIVSDGKMPTEVQVRKSIDCLVNGSDFEKIDLT